MNTEADSDRGAFESPLVESPWKRDDVTALDQFAELPFCRGIFDFFGFRRPERIDFVPFLTNRVGAVYTSSLRSTPV